MRKKLYLLIFFLISLNLLGNKNSIPMIPMLPSSPIVKPEINEDGDIKTRKLLKIGNINLKIKAKVIVPLEVISDIDIKALIIDDDNLKIPFELELSKNPGLLNIYKLNFSSTKIDIDNDGNIDTEIFTNNKIDKRIIQDNYIKIIGKNISKEGTHKKRIYVTVEVRE